MTTSDFAHSKALQSPSTPADKAHSEVNSNTPHDSEHRHTSKTHSHGHVHSEESLRQIVNRLSRIEGHIRGIKMMVQEGRPCPDVLIQIAAVRGALDRVARIILDEHLMECVARAAQEGNIEAELAELKAAIDRFLP
jgi:DNA-binding FrmR family transcriptional regulator